MRLCGRVHSARCSGCCGTCWTTRCPAPCTAWARARAGEGAADLRLHSLRLRPATKPAAARRKVAEAAKALGVVIRAEVAQHMRLCPM